MVFLPKGASIIDISPLNHEDKPAWTFYMASDFGVLAFNPIRIPQQRPLPMLHKLKAYKQWHQLTPEWRCVHPLAKNVCNVLSRVLPEIFACFCAFILPDI